MQYGLIAWNALRGVERALTTADATLQAASTKQSTTAPPAATSEKAVPADVRLEGLTFSYSATTPVLRGVDLALPAGRSTALVGINGAGKSTLVKLLAGYYQPLTGQTLIDGVSLNPSQAREWQRSIAILFQDYMPYQLSLRDNVVMQSPQDQADDELVASALHHAGLGEVLSRLDQGLDTPMSRLSPGGTDLSGGQWQRLALARAIYAVRTGSRLLVMDEPTSQMDARGEAEFYQRFLDLTNGVTTLVISHRFSSVRRADRIAVLDGGVITELGNHDELTHAGGTYARMFAAQADRYGMS
jgi:ATP-binding cassette subfamily B protein